MVRGSWTLSIGSTTLLGKLKRGVMSLLSVDEDLAYIKIGNVGSDDHGIGVGKDNALFFFFGECDGFLSDSSNLAMASFSDAENLRVPNNMHVVLDRLVARIGNRCSATDQVNLSIVWLFRGRSRVDTRGAVWKGMGCFVRADGKRSWARSLGEEPSADGGVGAKGSPLELKCSAWPGLPLVSSVH
ncbi:unnamed protein product, partial [Prunus brigantina]